MLLMFLACRKAIEAVTNECAVHRQLRDSDAVIPSQIVRDPAWAETVVLPYVEDLALEVGRRGSPGVMRNPRPVT